MSADNLLEISTVVTVNNVTLNRNEQKQNHHSSFIRMVERNAIYLGEQFNYFFKAKILNSSTNFMPGVCGAIIFVYLLNFFFSVKHYDATLSDESQIKNIPYLSFLTLTPGNILAPNYWLLSCISMLTYPFVEFHWWQVVNDILIVSLCTTLIEPLWGRKDLITFFFVVNIFVAFFTIIHYIFLYSIYGDAKYLYDVKLYGLSGFCAAVCVTVKQILPESVLIATSFGKIKNNNVPLCGLLASYIFYLVNIIDGSLTLMFFYGLITSWFYLRFIQFHPSSNLRGDLSPSFDFATFFPNVLKPIVVVISNYLYSFFVKLNLLSATSHQQYHNLRILSEKLSHEHSTSIISRHLKQHQSGNYDYLHQPKVENM